MFTKLKRLLGSSRPIMLMTALVAVLGITGTAYGARLVTGRDIKDGSITAVDLSKSTRSALHGVRGAKGTKGNAGAAGARGTTGLTGVQGDQGRSGDAGTIGLTGTRGLIGVAGNDGLDGVDGADAVSYFAAVTATGVLSTTRGVASVVRTATGVYDVRLTGAPNASTCVAVAQITDSATGDSGGADAAPDLNGHVAVRTYEIGDTVIVDGAANDHAFVVTVSC